MTIPMIVSIAIFAITFLFILTERINRTVIAFVGAMIMVLAGVTLDFYHPHSALAAIDFNTIGLLFGMMVLVVVLEHTGFFQYISVWVAKKTGGNPWYLLLSLGALTSVLSMIIDNVTMIILIIPITLIITKMIDINPVPILLAQAILSNIGGTATLPGDPPNIIIGSAAGLTFNDFLTHSLPVVVVAWFITILIFRVFYSKTFTGARPKAVERLMAMDENDAITDPRTLKMSLGVLALVIVLFFAHSALHLEPSIIALFGASLILILSHATKDPQPILEKTELSVLLFFASLFVLVGGLEEAGILNMVAGFIIEGATENLLLTAIILMWASAVISGIVDNIPLTVAMVPIIVLLGESGIAVEILWWALVFGVGFGGNSSPIGSTAGVIVTSKSQQTDTPISFIQWMKTGLPATGATLAVATVALIMMWNFEWVDIEGAPVAEASSEVFEITQEETSSSHSN